MSTTPANDERPKGKEAHYFQKGQVANPLGRQGAFGGRRKILNALDSLLSEESNQKTIIAALRAHLEKEPVKFFKEIVMPLLPREAKISVEEGGIVKWTSLLESLPRDDNGGTGTAIDMSPREP